MIINSFLISSVFLFCLIQITFSDIYVYNNSNKLSKEIETEDPQFEPSFPPSGLTGYLLRANPPEACQQISSPPSLPTSDYQWIALIRRSSKEGSCSFTTKIENAFNANFSAVIIYNYEDAYISMGPSGADVGIPSTFISLSDGLSLIQNYLYNVTSVNGTPTYYIKIVPDSPFRWGLYIIPFIVIISISFFGLLGFILVKCYLERRRTRRHRLPRSALKQLRTKKFVKTDPWEVCAVCLDDYEEGAKLRILPCEHAYHMKCIDPWLINNRRQCPVCKRYVFPNTDHSDEENGDQQNTRTVTERTPLIQSNDETSSMTTSRNRQSSEHQTIRPLGSGIPYISFGSSESSDDDKDDFLSSGSRRTTTTTTAELVFEQAAANSRRNGSLNGSLVTSRAANFFVGSVAGTDNTNPSGGRSIVEDFPEIEINDDHNAQMQSDIHGSEDNRAYADDEQSTDTN